MHQAAIFSSAICWSDTCSLGSLEIIHSPCATADVYYFEVGTFGWDSRVDKISKVLHPMMMHQVEAFEWKFLVSTHAMVENIAALK